MIPYLIKSFRGGVSDENDKGIPGSFKHGQALDIHKRNDSLSCKGSMATVLDNTTAVLGSNTGTTMTGIVNVFLPISDGSLLAFTDRGSIWCRSGDGQWQWVYDDENGKIIGAGQFEDDDGNNYIFWATQTAIARKLFPGSWTTAPDTGQNKWADAVQVWKTEFVSADAKWHPMKVAAGALYVGNGEALAEIDFASLAWDPLAMNIRPGNLINALEERNDYVILGSERQPLEEEGHVWSWTPVAANYVEKKKIPIQGVNTLIHTELPILQGGDSGEFFFSDFQTVVPLNGIVGGGKCNPFGSTIENDIALFGMYGGTYTGLWSYGRRRKNRPFALNYEYRLAKTVNGSSISTIGAVAMQNGELLASWGTTDGSTSEYGVDQMASTSLATAIYEGLEFEAGKPYMKKKFNSAKVTMAELPSGTSISLKYKVDRATTWKYAFTGANSTTFSTTGASEAEFIINDRGAVYEVGLELNPSGSSTPEIFSITTYMDESMYEHG